MAPPDIVLNTNMAINNPNGTVNITSAAGDIYIYGKIDAGSLNILAKNGDFVSSYVDGFDHIGGDPASFNNHTDPSEAGIGIIANGAISISARYLNINSTIQSGIANWTANLGSSNDPELTTGTASLIGITDPSAITNAISDYISQLKAGGSISGTKTLTNSKGQSITLDFNPSDLNLTELSAAITSYDNAIVANPSATAVYAVHDIGGAIHYINIKDYLTPGGTDARLEFDANTAQAFSSGNSATTGVFGVISPNSNIGISYDANAKEYILDGTDVHGGYVQLFGQIINTADPGAGNTPVGQINVLDGFGTINVTNTSNIPVVLQTLDTGSDDSGTGAGIEGVIDLTDITAILLSDPNDATVSASNPEIKVQHTHYTRVGSDIQVTTQTGRINNQNGEISYGAATSSAVSNSRSTEYDPTAGQRYVWTTATDNERKTSIETDQEELFGTSTFTIDSNTSFQITSDGTLDSRWLADGNYVSSTSTQEGSTDFLYGGDPNQDHIIVPTLPGYQQVDNSTLELTDLVSSSFSYLTNQDDPNYLTITSGPTRHCNWWTICIDSDVTTDYLLDQKYTTITTNSLKADNPIGINFIGSDTGGITVASKSDIILDGPINSRGGTVSICA